MTDETAADDSQALGGLLDGRSQWAPRSADDVVAVLRDGLIVLDANVLLHLYRYGAESRKQLLESLRLVGDRLFVPDRAATEFLRNRSNVAMVEHSELNGKIRSVTSDLVSIGNKLRDLGRARGLSAQQQKDLTKALERAERSVRKILQESVEDRAWASSSSGDDPILPDILELLTGRVGRPYLEAELQTHIAEGNRRVGAGEPPGFMDKDKPEPWGDYLVWRQALDEAKRRSLSILFVSDDLKDDWYLTKNKVQIGPHPSLIKEARDEADADLFLTSVPGFLTLARDNLEADVSESTLEVAEEEARGMRLGFVMYPTVSESIAEAFQERSDNDPARRNIDDIIRQVQEYNNRGNAARTAIEAMNKEVQQGLNLLNSQDAAEARWAELQTEESVNARLSQALRDYNAQLSEGSINSSLARALRDYNAQLSEGTVNSRLARAIRDYNAQLSEGTGDSRLSRALRDYVAQQNSSLNDYRLNDALPDDESVVGEADAEQLDDDSPTDVGDD